MRAGTPTRLVFTPQVHCLMIDAGPTADGGLYEARFEGPASKVTSDPGGGTITFIRRGQVHPFDFARRSAFITLAPGSEWDIEIQGDATHITADLAGVRLNSLSVTGSLARSAFLLPETDRVVPVRVGGGVLPAERHPGRAARQARPHQPLARRRVGRDARRLRLAQRRRRDGRRRPRL